MKNLPTTFDFFSGGGGRGNLVLLLVSRMFCFAIILDTYDVVTCLGGFDIGNIPTASLTELVKMAKPGKRAFYIFSKFSSPRMK